jgi:hypothetical protein
MASTSQFLFGILLSLDRLSASSLHRYQVFFFILNSDAPSNLRMQTLYSVILLMHSNCSLIKTMYYFMLGEIIITPILLPCIFAASSKYNVH